MLRYSKIDVKMKREFLLLQGRGCKWKKCAFCDYHLDVSSDPFLVNRPVLERVTGEYGTLDIINSGSVFELDEQTLSLIEKIVREKQIKSLWFESHWMYREKFEEFKKRFNCEVHFRVGVETFNPQVRKRWNKGIGEKVTADEIANWADGVCLLTGIEGQSKEEVLNDVYLADKYFSYFSLNLFCENTTPLKRDKELAAFVIKEIAPALRSNPKAEVLIDNTDLGVG